MEELEKIITFALKDGVVTDKERELILSASKKTHQSLSIIVLLHD